MTEFDREGSVMAFSIKFVSELEGFSEDGGPDMMMTKENQCAFRLLPL